MNNLIDNLQSLQINNEPLINNINRKNKNRYIYIKKSNKFIKKTYKTLNQSKLYKINIHFFKNKNKYKLFSEFKLNKENTFKELLKQIALQYVSNSYYTELIKNKDNYRFELSYKIVNKLNNHLLEYINVNTEL
jgi:hypothetical protein